MNPKDQEHSKSKPPKSEILAKPIKKITSKQRTTEPHLDKNIISKAGESLETRIRNWLIVAFTAVLAFYSIRLYETAIRQTNIANKSSEAALLSAKAANNSVELSKKSFRVENRAYVVIKKWNVTYPYDDTTKISWIEFENVGNTPAKKLKILFALGYDTALTLDGINEKMKNEEMQFASKRDLGPNAPTQQKFPLARNDSNMHAEIKSGNFKMYAIANITYFDVFAEEHFTHFCCVWNIETEMAEILPFYNDSN